MKAVSAIPARTGRTGAWGKRAAPLSRHEPTKNCVRSGTPPFAKRFTARMPTVPKHRRRAGPRPHDASAGLTMAAQNVVAVFDRRYGDVTVARSAGAGGPEDDADD